MRTALLTPPAWVIPLTGYLAFLAASRTADSTRKLRSYHLRRFATETRVDPFAADLDTLIGYLAAHAWNGSTMRSASVTLKGFYGWAFASGRMDVDVSAGLPTVTAPRGLPRPAPEDAVRFGLADSEVRVRIMVQLAAHAGLRCCEIARVHSDDVREGFRGFSLRILGKGDKLRTVPIPAALAATLRALPTGWAFPGRIDGHLSAGYVSKLLSAALPSTITAHTLRHRFASRTYVGTGKDIRAVQELLGHASVATTQIYTAVDDDVMRRGVEFAAASGL
ncbi:tyrosine-type recombinase/integrase [Microbacteriaceae bacterium VKM Ac-2854]|nr:tyrosine-type recombinase/integrase [Microbacteriaceae bacterium VKM Ac-2854]